MFPHARLWVAGSIRLNRENDFEVTYRKAKAMSCME